MESVRNNLGMKRGLLEDVDLLWVMCHGLLLTFWCLYSLHFDFISMNNKLIKFCFDVIDTWSLPLLCINTRTDRLAINFSTVDPYFGLYLGFELPSYFIAAYRASQEVTSPRTTLSSISELPEQILSGTSLSTECCIFWDKLHRFWTTPIATSWSLLILLDNISRAF